MTTNPYGVTLSPSQKKSLGKAFKENSSLTIRLSAGSDLLLLTETQIEKLNKGSEITLSETQIRENIERGPLSFDDLDIIEFNDNGTVTLLENHPFFNTI